MSMQCAICHKKAMRGNKVSHSKQRTHRSFKPNLHRVTALLSGVRQSLRVCTKCLRRLKKPFIKKGLKVQELKTIVPEIKQIPKESEETKVKEVKVKTMTIEELIKEAGSSQNSEKPESDSPVKTEVGKTTKKRKKTPAPKKSK